MKHKIKVTQHGTTWVDPTPPPVILCPECGSEKLINTFNLNRCYKNFLVVYLEREGDCRKCKDCGCIFEIDSKIKVKTEPAWIAFVIFLISFIIMIVLISVLTSYKSMEEAPALLVLGFLSSISSTIVSFAFWLGLL